MAIATPLSTAESIFAVLRHLGIERAHVAARDARDWQSFAASYPERIASLTLVCPQGMDPGILRPLASRLLVFASDRGRPAEMAHRVVASLAEASLITLHDYVNTTPYIDVAADRSDDIGVGLMDFLSRMDQLNHLADVSLDVAEGEIEGISYRTQGRGAPLVLFPLSVAPSQWEPLLARLSERYFTIVLGGAALGMVGSLEARGHTAGYLRVVWNLLEAAQLQPGETLLEVGCGTGVLDRWMAQRTGRANRISAVDINPFLLREAAALARREGVADVIEFHQGSAEALPFPDQHFDVTMSSTVIQRVDADRKLAEMVRVTKSGGRVAVVGHAHDIPLWVNLPLRAELKAKIEAPGWESTVGHERGCDDASLYRRFQQAGLAQVRMFPQFAAFDDASRLQTMQTTILPTLNAEEAQEWHDAVARAEAEGTFFIANPFHCAVGTKP